MNWNLILVSTAALWVVNVAAHNIGESDPAQLNICKKEHSALDIAASDFIFHENHLQSRQNIALQLQKNHEISIQIYREGLTVAKELHDNAIFTMNCVEPHLLDSHPYHISLSELESMSHAEMIEVLNEPTPGSLPCQFFLNKYNEANQVVNYLSKHSVSRYEAALAAKNTGAEEQVYKDLYESVALRSRTALDYVNCETETAYQFHGLFDTGSFEIKRFVDYGFASTLGEIRQLQRTFAYSRSTLNEQEARELISKFIVVHDETEKLFENIREMKELPRNVK